VKKTVKPGDGKAETVLKRTLADACRLLALAGQGDDVWGHVTARVPGTDTFWMKPAGLGLEEIRPDDLLLVDLDGKVLRGRRPRHSEVFIHAEILRARPEVGSVVHTHPLHATVFSSLGVPLRPIMHEGTNFVPPDVPRFEETTDLIVSPALGRAVARVLGDRPALFLVSHGIVTAGATIEEAAVNAILLDKAARAQLMVPGGNPRFWTNDAEALVKRQRIYNADSLTSRWVYLLRVLAASRHPRPSSR
jgi:L-ribulose-5-phosphate 4-epimerase